MSDETGSSGSDLCSVDFEIFGYVQGVCFRMYSERKGLSLGVAGWVKNTNRGTVLGQVQGPRHLVNEMWHLEKRGKCICECYNPHLLCISIPLFSVLPQERGWVPEDSLPIWSSSIVVLSQHPFIYSIYKLRKIWLSKEGSPSSRITRAVFKNERPIPTLEVSGFSTRF